MVNIHAGVVLQTIIVSATCFLSIGLVHIQFVVVLLQGYLCPRIRIATCFLFFHEKISDWKNSYCLKEFPSYDIFIMDPEKPT